MTTLFVNYSEEYLGGGEICAGQENDAWPSHEDTIQRFTVDNITLSNVTPYHETVEYDLTTPLPVGLFVVVAHYYDGGTFGRTCGYGSIEGVFATHEEAQARADAIDKGAPSVRGYTPWTGYFAGLERTEVVLAALLK